MNHSIELLAPVGSMESLAPAVFMGADAVYLGLGHFNARRRASNLTEDELKTAIDFCHLRDVHLYLTLNTLVNDEEWPEVYDLLSFASDAGVDAIIVQDVGLASFARQHFPSLTLHASTQMSIHTPEGVQCLAELGFSRAVLARELSYEEIREISASSPIELEVFVHGAHCVSVSGQCYFSAMLGGRSANRGLCAQPCRLPFSTLPGRDDYALSLKDLCLLPHIKQLSDMGITSLKIEGRMKRPEYVAATVRAYRKAIDGEELPEEERDNLRRVFSRSGFTDGYFLGRRTSEMFGHRSKRDVQMVDEQFYGNIRALYRREVPRIPIYFSLSLMGSNRLALCARDEDGHVVKREVEAERSQRPHNEQRALMERALSKTGGTPFYCKECHVEISEQIFVPISVIKQLRRDVLEEMVKLRTERKKFIVQEVFSKKMLMHRETKKLEFRARFPSALEIPDCFTECELIYVPSSTPLEKLEELLKRGFRIGLEIPRLTFGREEEERLRMETARTLGIVDTWVGNLSSAKIARDCGNRVHGGFSLNLFNREAIEWAENFGFSDIELSSELSMAQIAKLPGDIRRGIFAYGRFPMMLLRNCPGGSKTGRDCVDCKKQRALIDRRNVVFPFACREGFVELYNSVPHLVGNGDKKREGIDFLLLFFTVENSVEMEEKFQVFHCFKPSLHPTTRGLSFKGVD